MGSLPIRYPTPDEFEELSIPLTDDSQERYERRARQQLDVEGLGGDVLSAKDRTRQWRIQFAAGNLYHVDRWRQLRGGRIHYNEAVGIATAKTAPQGQDFTPVLKAFGNPVTVINGDQEHIRISLTVLAKDARAFAERGVGRSQGRRPRGLGRSTGGFRDGTQACLGQVLNLHEPKAGTGTAWRRTEPVAVLFFFGRTVRKLVANGTNVLASAAGLFVLLKQHVLLAATAVVLVLLVLAVVAVLRYLHFRFKVDDERVLIRQGVVRKTQLDMRFDRIQGISTEQSLVYRMLGLVTIRFDTAGSTGNEGYLPAVTPEFTDLLRERVDTSAVAPSESVAETRGAVILRLEPRDVALVGLTDPRVTQILVAGVAVLSFLYQGSREVLDALFNVAREAVVGVVGLGFLAGLVVVVGLVIGVVGLLILASIAWAFLRYHGFELRQEASAVSSHAGLLTRRDVVVEVSKIQQLHVVQGLIMRRLQRFRLDAVPATSGNAAPSSDAVEKLRVPLLNERQVEEVRRRTIADENPAMRIAPECDAYVAVSPYFMWPGVLWGGLVPAVVATIVLSLFWGAPGLVCLAWIGLSVPLAWLRWRRQGVPARRRRLGVPIRIACQARGRVRVPQGAAGDRPAIASAATQGTRHPVGLPRLGQCLGTVHRPRHGPSTTRLHAVQSRGEQQAVVLTGHVRVRVALGNGSVPSTRPAGAGSNRPAAQRRSGLARVDEFVHREGLGAGVGRTGTAQTFLQFPPLGVGIVGGRDLAVEGHRDTAFQG